jgi:hypothetical protein
MDFATWITIVTTWLTLAESFNCIYPRIEEDYNSEGLVCQWEEEDFNYDEKIEKWVLKYEDKDDNWVESKVRKIYRRKK